MFVVNEDNSIYATRGDIVFFSVAAEENGENHTFQAGDVVRIKIYGKKDCETVVLQKDFPVTEATDIVDIYLTKEDTKIGEVISKPTDYWYEVELNPFDNPQTIIGYGEDGAKVFKLFPEGDDIPEYVYTEEDIPFIDDELSVTSTRPVENRVIAKAVAQLERADKAQVEQTAAIADSLGDTKTAIVVEKARIDNLVSGATADDAEVIDVRVDIGGVVHSCVGDAVRLHLNSLAKVITDITYVSGTYVTKSGKVNSLSSSKSSDYVDISDYAGENLLLYSCLFDSAGFAIYDKNKVCITGVDGSSCGANPTYGYYSISLPVNAHYIRFSVLTSKMDSGKIIIYPGNTGTKLVYNALESISYTTVSLDGVEYTDSHCIKGKNGIVVDLGTSHPLAASDFVDISGFGLYDLYITAVFSGYSGMAFYDSNRKYIEGHSGDSLGSSADAPVEIVVKTPVNAKYIRFTAHEDYDGYSVKFKENASNIVTEFKTVKGADYSYAVENVLCIGDSLTSGANYISQGGSSIQQNFPYYLGRMLNCNSVNAGKSGFSASDWYKTYGGSYNYANYDTFIVWLGANYGCGAMPTDDEISAFVPDTSVTAEDAEQALYLIKIITDIQKYNPDALIVLCNTFASKTDVTTHNETIAEIAGKYGLMLLDMSDLSAANYPELHGGISNPHFGKAGNIFIADRIKNSICAYIAENPLRAEFGYSARKN